MGVHAPSFLKGEQMKYYIDEEEFDSVEDVLDYCIEDDYHEDDEYFEEWVNTTYGSFTINGEEYWAYDIVNDEGGSNYRDLLDRYCENENDNDREKAEWELFNAKNEEEVYIQRYTVLCEEDDVKESDDTDDDDHLAMTRSYIEEQKLLDMQKKETEKKDEDDLMKVFQIIGV